MRLFFRKTGSGVPLVILHGLFGTSNNWNSLAKLLSDSFAVYALDLRNHGHSPHDPVHTYPAMAGDVVEFLKQESLPSVYLLGHSMGGKAAMEVALSFPALVQKLIIVDMSPGEHPLQHEGILRSLESVRLPEFSSRAAIDLFLRTRIPDDRVRAFLLTNLRRAGNGAFHWMMNLEAIEKNKQAIAAPLEGGRRYPGATLFIRAEHSAYIREEQWPLIVSLFPHAQLETVTGSGHWVHADAPEAFLAVVRAFLHSST